MLGMLLSGMLHVLLPAGFVRKRFRGTRGVFSAVTLGIPLPLCSCGVVPAGIGLKNEGASDGAAVGFLISTPQTGVDSIMVCASFFGWPFALFKMLAALVTGVVGGLLTESQVVSETDDPAELKNVDSIGEKAGNKPQWWEIFTHGLEILRSIWVWLVIGIFVSAAIELWIPQTWIESIGEMGLLPAMFLVLLVSTPLYVCATASVPIAAALVAAGMPPAVAMVFLMAGPATNATTLGAVFGRFGWKTLMIYLLSIIGGSMLFAWMFDWLITADVSGSGTHIHDHTNWISILSGVLLVAMLAWFAVEALQRMVFRSDGDATKDGIDIPVEGLHCQSCVSKLEKQLLGTPNVTSARVQLKPGIAFVTGNVGMAEIQQAIRDAGFTPSQSP